MRSLDKKLSVGTAEETILIFVSVVLLIIIILHCNKGFYKFIEARLKTCRKGEIGGNRGRTKKERRRLENKGGHEVSTYVSHIRACTLNFV